MRDKFLKAAGIIERRGIEELKKFLNDRDFFTAPCSTNFHLAREGGLVEHSLNVYNLLKEKVERYGLEQSIPLETIAICGLFHDLCKTDLYVKKLKWFKENGKWIEKHTWACEDKFPYGHGEKSVSILQDFIPLTGDEKLAIRWHMLAFDAGIHFNYPSGYAFREASKIPLVTLLFTADYEASQIIENK